MFTTIQIPGIPAGPELLVVLLLWIIVAFFVGRWVYRDAKRRGSNWAWQWGFGIGVLLITVGPGLIALIIYLLVRSDKTQQKQQTS